MTGKPIENRTVSPGPSSKPRIRYLLFLRMGTESTERPSRIGAPVAAVSPQEQHIVDCVRFNGLEPTQGDTVELPASLPRLPPRLGTLKGTILHIAADFDAIPEGFEDYMP